MLAIKYDAEKDTMDLDGKTVKAYAATGIFFGFKIGADFGGNNNESPTSVNVFSLPGCQSPFVKAVNGSGDECQFTLTFRGPAERDDFAELCLAMYGALTEGERHA